jgi:ribosomal protein S4E
MAKFEHEYRAYYDEQGNVTTYAMTDVEGMGKWIKITKEQFAEANPFCRVVDGVLKKLVHSRSYLKLIKTDDEAGIKTAKHDICILVDNTEYNKWKPSLYESASRYS